MAKDKERSINPAQQQRKLEKAKALKKSKAELQTRRNEKLARRNPDRIQRQIEDLKALEASGDIKAREKAILDDLERDLKAVRKAREALGEKAPQYGNRQPSRRDDGDNNSSVLGKRRHGGERKPYHSRRDSSGSDTDDSVRRIPMPEDTPPPIPREHRRYFQQDKGQQPAFQPVPVVETKTTYSAAPQIRDLKKEAVSKFVPNIVRQKQAAVRGTGGLVEPEEMDRLEAAGYLRTNHDRDANAGADADADANEARRLAEEEARFEREMAMVDIQPEHTEEEHKGPRKVEIEEVEDEDG
jgi:WW domain binding protein 11